MTAPNHIVGGYCFTGIISSILGINILQDYRLLIIIFVAALLPDIDHSKSLIGRVFFPISKFLHRHYGHRTITHSLYALGVLTALMGVVESLYMPDSQATTVFGLTYGSHLLFDCMTVQGVPLLYPFKKNPFVLPGNPNMRLRTSSVRHETMVLCFFSVSAVFMQPLMADGFWTTYNSIFGTYKHMVSEFHKSDDMLKLQFVAQTGTQIDTISGLVVSIKSSKFTIIDKKKNFQSYPKDGQLITDYVPIHTGKQYGFVDGELSGISADSLMRLVRTCECTEINVQATDKFVLMEDALEHSKSALKLSYPNDLRIHPIDAESALFQTSPAIQSYQEEIRELQRTYDAEYGSYKRELQTFESLKRQAQQERDYVKKEILMEQFSKAKSPTPPGSIGTKLNNYRRKIQELKKSDAQEYEKEVEKLKRPELTFTGTYTQLQINGKNI